MKANDKNLNWIQSSVKKLEIPFFQRPYVWNNDDCEALLNGIIEAVNGKMPFIGSFILKDKNGNESDFLVIDGQQRLTTLSIFIKAILDKEILSPSTNASHTLKGIIYNVVTDFNGVDVYTPKIEPSNADKKTFNFIMSYDNNELNNYDNIPNDYIGSNYKFFCKFLDKNPKEDSLKLAIKLTTSKSFFIAITLENEDDEQKIFDSVNTLGRPLSCADIIKNYLYQKLKEQCGSDNVKINQILNHYKNYWDDVFYTEDRRAFWDKTKILGRIKTNYLDIFLKEYATIKGIYVPSSTGGVESIAQQFKKYIDKLNYDEIIELSKEIAKYANEYYTYRNNYENCQSFERNDYVNNCLLVMDKLDTSTFNPFILKTMVEKPRNINERLFALEKFVLSRYLYDGKTKNYNKCCVNLISKDDPIDYLVKYNTIEDPIDTSVFPSKLHKVKNNSHGTLMLFLIEEILRFGQENLYSDKLRYNYSLEHIMPIKWHNNWYSVKCYKFNEKSNSYEELDFNVPETVTYRNLMIQSIGNMCLLTQSLNSSISNNSLIIKMEGNTKHDGVKKYASSIEVTKQVVQIYESNKEWNEKYILEREQVLFNILNDFYKF